MRKVPPHTDPDYLGSLTVPQSGKIILCSLCMHAYELTDEKRSVMRLDTSFGRGKRSIVLYDGPCCPNCGDAEQSSHTTRGQSIEQGQHVEFPFVDALKKRASPNKKIGEKVAESILSRLPPTSKDRAQ